jgi:hypothetical protein
MDRLKPENVMRKKRTDVDFSNHVLTITRSKDYLVYNFAIPGTRTKSIRFINTHGIMAVTGDYGNWIFCREFHRSSEGVSDMYWVEKLKIASTQDPYNFDSEAAVKEIEELLENPDHEFSDQEKDWLERLKVAAKDGEYSYIAEAMDRPGSFEAEMIPRGKVYNSWLPIIFDAFDEICQRVLPEPEPIDSVKLEAAIAKFREYFPANLKQYMWGQAFETIRRIFPLLHTPSKRELKWQQN